MARKLSEMTGAERVAWLQQQRQKKTAGIDTFENDLTGVYESLGGIDGWRDKDTMAGYGSSVSSMLKRANAYRDYYKSNDAAYDSTEIDKTIERLTGASEWLAERSEVFGGYESADDYNAAVKKYADAEAKYGGLSSAELKQVMEDYIAERDSKNEDIDAQIAEERAIYDRLYNLTGAMELDEDDIAFLAQYGLDPTEVGYNKKAAEAVKALYKDTEAKIAELEKGRLAEADTTAQHYYYQALMEELGAQGYTSEKKGSFGLGTDRNTNFDYAVRAGEDAINDLISAQKLATGAHTDFEATGYGTLTDEEKSLYLYLYDNVSPEAAVDYYNYLYNTNSFYNMALAARVGVSRSEAKSDFERVMGAFGAGLNSWIAGNERAIKSLYSDEAVPTYPFEYEMQFDRETLDDSVVKKGLYDLGVSFGNMAPSVLAGVLTSGMGTGVQLATNVATFGVSIYGNAYDEALKQGYSKSQAINYGILNAASEVALQNLLGGIPGVGQHLTGEFVTQLANKTSNVLLKVAAQIGGDALGEFTEEYLQEVLGQVFRNVALGENGEVKLFSEEALYSGIIGALMSMGMSVPVEAVNAVNLNSVGKLYNTEISETADGIGKTGAQALIEEGLAANPTSEAYQYAKRLSKRQKDGKTISNIQMGTLARLIERTDAVEPSGGNVQFQIRYTIDNAPVVEVTEDILEGVPRSEWVKTVKNKIAEFAPSIPLHGRLVKVNQKTKNEYTNSKYTQKKKRGADSVYEDKLKAAGKLDEIVLASTNYINEDLKHERADNIKEFARGDVNLRIGEDDYSAKVIVGFTKQNEMVLYDVIDFIPRTFRLKEKNRASDITVQDTSKGLAGSDRQENSVDSGNGQALRVQAKGSPQLTSETLDGSPTANNSIPYSDEYVKQNLENNFSQYKGSIDELWSAALIVDSGAGASETVSAGVRAADNQNTVAGKIEALEAASESDAEDDGRLDGYRADVETVTQAAKGLSGNSEMVAQYEKVNADVDDRKRQNADVYVSDYTMVRDLAAGGSSEATIRRIIESGNGAGASLNEAQFLAAFYEGRALHDQQKGGKPAVDRSLPRRVGKVYYNGAQAVRVGGSVLSLPASGISSGKKLNADQQAVVDFAEKVLAPMGVDVVLYSSRKDRSLPNGLYDGKNIYIDIEAGMSERASETFVTYALAHELTHMAERLSPELWQKYADAVLDILAREEGISIRGLMERRKLEYADARIGSLKKTYPEKKDSELRDMVEPLSDDGAIREIVADASQLIFTRESRFAEKLAAKDATLWGKIKQLVMDAIKKLQEVLHGVPHDGISEHLVNHLEELREYFDDMMADTLYQAGYGTAEENDFFAGAMENGKQKEKSRTTGTVQFQYLRTQKDGRRVYVTDFGADVSQAERVKLFKERIATIFNLGMVTLKTDAKKIQVKGDRFTAQKNIYGDEKGKKGEKSAKINALYDLADILQTAVYLPEKTTMEESYTDPTIQPKNKAHENVKYWYKFQNKIVLDGVAYTVTFNIRDKGKDQYQYLIDFHEERAFDQSHTVKNDLRRADQTPYDNSISQNQDLSTENSEVSENSEITDGSDFGGAQAQERRAVTSRTTGTVQFQDRAFSEQVDDIEKNRFPRGNLVYVGKTPSILQKVGLNGNLPMLTTATHIKKALEEKIQDDHTHGLTKDQIKALPEKIANPVMIMDSLNDGSNSIVIVTDMLDGDKNPVIIAVKADSKGMYHNIEVNSNFILTYYGKDGFHNFIDKNVQNNTFLFIDEKRSRILSNQAKVQFFGKLKSYDLDTIIRKTKANVKPFVEKNYSGENDAQAQERYINPNMTRQVLARGLSYAVVNAEERAILDEYTSELEQYSKKQKRLYEVKRELKELVYRETLSPEEREDMKALREERDRLQKQLNNYDKRLLKMEALAPLQNLALRERRKAVDKAKKDTEQKINERNRRVQLLTTADREASRLYTMLSHPNKKKHIPSSLQPLVKRMFEDISFVRHYGKIESTKEQLDSIRAEIGRLEAYVPTQEILEKIDSWKAMEQKLVKKLESYDVAASRTWAERIDNLRQFVAVAQGEAEKGFHVDFRPNIAEELAQMYDKALEGEKEKPIYIFDRSLAEVEQYSELIASIAHTVSQVNKLYSDSYEANLSVVGDQAVQQMKNKKQRRAENAFQRMQNGISDFIMLDNMTPTYYAEYMGVFGRQVIGRLMNGFYDFANKTREVIAFNDALEEKYHFSNWTGKNAKIITVKTNEGKWLSMTIPQIMTLYCHSNIKTSLGHILSEEKGEGIKVVEDELAKAIGKNKQEGENRKSAETRIASDGYATRLTEQDMRKLISKLSKKQKECADEIKAFMSNTLASWGNSVTQTLYLYDAYVRDNYFPLYSVKSYIDTDVKTYEVLDKISLYTVLNKSFTKSLDPEASNPIWIGDIFNVFAEYSVNMTKYAAFGVATHDINKILNYRHRDENGHTDYPLKEVMERAYGKGAEDYIKDLVASIDGAIKGDGLKLIDTLIRNTKIASVGGNIRVALQQFSAYPKAGLILSPKNLAKAIGPAINPVWRNHYIKEAEEHSALMWWKLQGNYDTAMARPIAEQMRKEKGIGQTYNKIVDAAGAFAGWADRETWGTIWLACRFEIDGEIERESLPIVKNSAEYFKRVTDKFHEVINYTQIIDSPLHRSKLMRKKGWGWKMVTAYMGEPTQAMNMLTVEAYKALERHTDKTVKSRFCRAAICVFSSIVMCGFLKSIPQMWRDDDEDETATEKYWQAFLYDLVGYELGEDGGFTFLGVLSSDTCLLNNIPFVKDIISLMEGYSVERMDLTAVETTLQTFDALRRFAESDDEKSAEDIYNLVYKAAKALSQLSGIPLANILRDLVEPWFRLAQ